MPCSWPGLGAGWTPGDRDPNNGSHVLTLEQGWDPIVQLPPNSARSVMGTVPRLTAQDPL